MLSGLLPLIAEGKTVVDVDATVVVISAGGVRVGLVSSALLDEDSVFVPSFLFDVGVGTTAAVGVISSRRNAGRGPATTP